jgi:hypothetical protein
LKNFAFGRAYLLLAQKPLLNDSQESLMDSQKIEKSDPILKKLKLDGAKNKLNFLIYKFITTNGLPARLARSQDMSDIVRFAAENNQSICKMPDSDLCLSQNKFESIQVQQFNSTIATIKHIVTCNHTFFSDIYGKRIPFLTISHNIWDLKDFQILGVSLFLICCQTGEDYSYLLGFCAVRGNLRTKLQKRRWPFVLNTTFHRRIFLELCLIQPVLPDVLQR